MVWPGAPASYPEAFNRCCLVSTQLGALPCQAVHCVSNALDK